ncbi:MAG: putative endonuclease [Chlamydiales bacterium]|jgi:putative endonuclease
MSNSKAMTKPAAPDWSVYLIRCGDGSLYTGIATDVARRLEQHTASDGKGAKYLRGRGPLEVVLQHAVGGRGLALRVEGRIKKLPRAEKELLVAGTRGVEPIVASARD